MDWLPRDIHRSLVGCGRRQEVCPRNKDRMAFEVAPESFTVEETEAILSTAEAGESKSNRWIRPSGPVWESIARKLSALGQLHREPFWVGT